MLNVKSIPNKIKNCFYNRSCQALLHPNFNDGWGENTYVFPRKINLSAVIEVRQKMSWKLFLLICIFVYSYKADSSNLQTSETKQIGMKTQDQWSTS